jgi:hypothetical protein
MELKEFKVIEIYDTEMSVSNQLVGVFELAEIEKTPLLEDRFISTFGESKKFLVDLNSNIFSKVLEKAKNEENILLDVSEFRFRDEIRNGIKEEIAFHTNVFLMDVDKKEDFLNYYRRK